MDESFSLYPVAIVNHVRNASLEITWNDGHSQHLAHAYLRAHCRCADCVTGISNANALVPATLRLTDIRPVGNYGLQCIFNDRHERGIYPWSYLHNLGAGNTLPIAGSNK